MRQNFRYVGKGCYSSSWAVVGLRSSVIDTMSWRRCVQITVCAMIMIIYDSYDD